MKKTCSTRSAFLNRRVLVGLLLTLVSGILALLAFGLHSDSQKFASSQHPKELVPASRSLRSPGEPLPATLQDQTPANYTGPHHDSRPVKPLHTRPLRQLAKIPPPLVMRHEVREPARPKPPTDTPKGGFTQTLAGPVLSAPTSTGVSWDGVGVGFARICPLGQSSGYQRPRRRETVCPVEQYQFRCFQ